MDSNFHGKVQNLNSHLKVERTNYKRKMKKRGYQQLRKIMNAFPGSVDKGTSTKDKSWQDDDVVTS